MQFKYKYLTILLLLINGVSKGQSITQSKLEENNLDSICVTSGKLVKKNNLLYIDDGGMRAQIKNSNSQTAQIKFKYLGASTVTQPLASGELRRQIGLKLNAKDTCNLIYVMWHIQPNSKLGVSVKLNQGMDSHKQCGAGGYTNITSNFTKPLPKIEIGIWHTLLAQILGDNLLVYADNQLVWQGILPKEAVELKGSVGFRTDNGKFDVKFNSIKNNSSISSKNNCHKD